MASVQCTCHSLPIPFFGAYQQPRVLEDMITLCRKYCPHELSEIDAIHSASAPNSIGDEGELEHEYEEATTSLDNTAVAMGLEPIGLLVGLNEDKDLDRAIPLESGHRAMNDVESHANPTSKEAIEEPRARDIRESAIETNLTPLEEPSKSKPQLPGSVAENSCELAVKVPMKTRFHTSESDRTSQI